MKTLKCIRETFDDKNGQLRSWLGIYNRPTAPLQSGKTPTNECPIYDNKQTDSEVPIMLEF